MNNISLSKPLISKECIDDVVAVLESGWLVQGPMVSKFEQSIKDSLGIEHALAVNSATSGLHLALLSLGIEKGDEVIVPAFTWVASANVIEMCGAIPIFVDIDIDTLNADFSQILKKITVKTKAIMVVHLFGKPFDVEALRSKLPRKINIVEDASCALGASINGKFCGTMGEVGIFSFHPRKSITTGEGGMLVTDNADIYRQCNMMRNHGQDIESHTNTPCSMADCPVVGFNYRMTDFQAALGLQQHLKLNGMMQYRGKLARAYSDELSGCNAIRLPVENDNESHSWQSYVITLKNSSNRNYIMEKLKYSGIETRPGTHAVHILSYFKNKYNIASDDFPNTQEAYLSSISLPLHNHMSINDVKIVCKQLKERINAL